MKKLNKKGFTIVELVVVVAVIAILSAVLIPTVAGVVDKANQSADQAAVSTLNTILSAETPANIDEVEEIFAENGYNLKGYTPLKSGSQFVWDSVGNEILIVENGVATFPRGRAGETINTAWVVIAAENNFNIVNGNADLADAIDSNGVVRVDSALAATEAVEISKKIEMTLCANVSAPHDTTSKGVFHVNNGGNLTINADNSVVIDGCTDASDFEIAVWARGGVVTINGGTYTNVGAGEDDQYDLIYASHGGVIYINGGSFKSETPGWTLNVNNAANVPGTIVVSGGEFFEFNPSADTVMPDGRTCAQDGIVIAEGYEAVAFERDGATWYKVVPVAE